MESTLCFEMKLKTRLLLSMALASFNLFGATYYWNGGTITSLSSWPNAKGGSTFASNFTTSGDIWDLNLASSANVDISGWSTNGKLTNSAASSIIATLTTTSGDFTSSYVGAVWVVPATNLVVSGINIIYSAAGATIPGLTYANLRFSNSTGTCTAAAAISVSGTLTTTSGGTLAMGSNTLTLSGTATTLTNGGTITTSATTAFTDSRTTKTFGGTINYNRATGSRNIAIGNYTNLTLSNSSGTYTALGAITVSGTLTTTSGGTLAMGANTLTLSGTATLTNGGTITTSATTAFTDSRTTKTFGGTVNYGLATGGQTIPLATYANLTLSNSSGSQTLGGNIKIQGTLTITSGGKLNLNGYSIPAVNAFSGTGQIIGSSTSRINITGSSAGTFYMDQTTPLTTNRLKYLGLAASSTATLGNTIAIYGDSSYSGNVDLKLGSVLTSNTTATNAALLQLKYNVSSDYHAIVGFNGGSFAGEAMVEDYFYSGYRAYRQTGHLLDSALSLNQITDDFDLFGSISSGSSGRGSGGNKDGLYAATSTAKNSVFTYKEDVASGSRWIPFTTSISNSTIATGTGIMFVMRPAGSGESGNYNAQIMDYEGALNQRRRAVTVLKKPGAGSFGYNLISNPYAAYLDFDKFIDTNSSMMADLGFYKYDKSTKNYTAHSKSGPQWYKSSVAFNVNSANVDPGDAFWIRVNSAGTVYLNPKMTAFSKASDVSNGNKLEIDITAYSMLGIKMKSQADSTIGDEVSLLSASWGGDMGYKLGDMANMNGTCIDLAVLSSDKESIAFKTLDITKSWLIPLNVQACAPGSYSFDFHIHANKPGYEAEYELLDKYLNKSIKIVSGNKLIFDITSDNASMGGDRFYLNAVPSKVLNTKAIHTDKILTTFPNPISTNDVLKINVSQGKGLQIELVNAMGQQLYSAENVVAGKILEVDLMNLHLAPGVYYLKATRDNESETQRVIIN